MFKHLFMTMNEVLDEVIQGYPDATEQQKQNMLQQIDLLRGMSDTCCEEWLLFEEKMGKLHAVTRTSTEPTLHDILLKEVLSNQELALNVQRGQGYYKLGMFDQAISELSNIISVWPECLAARLYLAMAHLHKECYSEAYRHYTFILSLTEHNKLKAIVYNGMGCLQARQNHGEQAERYFQKACELDTSLTDPPNNLMVMLNNKEDYQFESGLENL